ncbi:MAG: YihY/virulence factor BrkB family protein [Bacteroidetes bacterium QS_8_64_10]|nr:MAG: YihY/virulence factor BrkB family protein [Bacteroidetes bacterium QS_8_64_10]
MASPTNPYSWADKLTKTQQWEYVRTTPVYYLKSIYREVMTKNIFVWGQAIAFKVLIATVPVIILATGILSGILSRTVLSSSEQAFAEVAPFIRQFLPSFQSADFLHFLRQLQRASGTLTWIGSIGLFFSAMTLFTTLRLTISNVFEEEWNESRTLFRGYAFDIRMVGQVGLLFLLTLGTSIAIQTLNTAGLDFITDLGIDQIWVQRGWRRLIQATGFVLPFLLTTAMFFQLFYYTPLPHPPRRCALKGALTTAVMWELAKYSFTLYATHAASFERYTAEGNSFILNDAFVLIIAFVVWAYFSGVVLMLGATVSMLNEKRYRARRRAEKSAAQQRRAEAQAESEETEATTSASTSPAAAPHPTAS